MNIVALIPAFQSAATIADTVRALKDSDRISEIVVVDDGSTDETATVASLAGARLIVLQSNQGKGSAWQAGVAGSPNADIFLTIDADTGTSARAALALLTLLLSDKADMVVGVLPSAGKHGGFGLVKRLAAILIKRASGFSSVAPLSGQRAIRREVFEACFPLASGFGVDSALTSDAAVHGFRIFEQKVEMTHEHRGRTLSGFMHRAHQGWDLVRAFAPRLRRST